MIEDLISGAEYMKENNYEHICALVRVGDEIDPLEFKREPDGTGEKFFLGLMFDQGEICMIDRTPIQRLFFRMDISPEGKIKSFYATLPPAKWHRIR